MFRPKALNPDQAEDRRTKDFFDLILPGTIRFLSDHYIVGDSYRCVWAVREYPPTTEEQTILSQLADRCGVTLRIYHRLVDAAEQRRIIQNAARRNRLKSGDNDVNASIEAQGNLQDVVELLANLRRNREPLLHCAVFIELKARNLEAYFVPTLASCFAPEQTDAQLIAAVNTTFGTELSAEEFTQIMAAARAVHIDTTGYIDPATKNNLDLVQWAIGAERSGWGYVWGTCGQVLDEALLEAKLEQYPDALGEYEAFIRETWLYRRTADCVGLIKGYGWFDPETQEIRCNTNGMPLSTPD
ncbi:MAG: hypothetical protein IJ357_03020 [Oscillospiraceae bacterium]|nr:hypothetical protein [Oscillospiraceae bacterium]